MIFKSKNIELSSSASIELIDITPQVEDFCRQTGFKDGLLTVSSLHTTVGISINEKCDALKKDVMEFFERTAPSHDKYCHNAMALDQRLNAHSHLLKYFIGTSETLILENGKLCLGTWQKIFVVELDGPRAQRQIKLALMGQSS